MLAFSESIKLLIVELGQTPVTGTTPLTYPTPAAVEPVILPPTHLPGSSLASTLQQIGYDVVTATDWGTTTLEQITNLQPSLLLVNLDTQTEPDALHIAEQCRAMGKPVVFLLASSPSHWSESPRSEKSYTYLLKPATLRQLLAAIEVTLYQHEQENLLLQTLTVQKEALERVVSQRTTELQQKNAEMRAVLQAFPDLCLTFDADGTYLDCEMGSSKDLYCSPEEFLGRKLEEVLPIPVAKQHRHAITRALKTKSPVNIEYELCINQQLEHYEARIAPLQEDRAIAAIRNISARKQAEAALRESEARFRQITENIAQAFFLESLDGQHKLYISPAYEHIWGQTCQSLYENPMAWLQAVHPEDRNRVTADHIRQIEMGKDLTTEYRIIRPDGSMRWIRSRTFIIADEAGQPYRLAGVAEDITEKRQTEDRIQQALAEKEILLKEIHHRVKNNLMIISSLLSLQARRMPDSASKKVFQDNEHRIFSMSLIHEKLYQSDNLSHINLGEYLQKLAEELFRSFGNHFDRIRLNLELAPVLVNIETAMPCGLILNELLSNSLKYAFPDDRCGEITICLKTNATQQIILTLSDNGIGIPIALAHSFSSFGLRLVKTLASQLKADLQCRYHMGTYFQLTFKELNYQQRCLTIEKTGQPP